MNNARGSLNMRLTMQPRAGDLASVSTSSISSLRALQCRRDRAPLHRRHSLCCLLCHTMWIIRISSLGLVSPRPLTVCMVACIQSLACKYNFKICMEVYVPSSSSLEQSSQFRVRAPHVNNACVAERRAYRIVAVAEKKEQSAASAQKDRCCQTSILLYTDMSTAQKAVLSVLSVIRRSTEQLPL